MTLEKQVHTLQVEVDRLRSKVKVLEEHSHPPVDIINAVKSAIKDGSLRLGVNGITGEIYEINH